MDTGYTNRRRSGSFGSAKVTPPEYLSHVDEPADRYTAYPGKDSMTANYTDNPANFFDDSDVEDRRWVQRVRRYLRRRSHASD